MRIMDLLHYLQKYKDALSWPMLFGKLIQNLFGKKWVEGFQKPCEYLGHSNILWNYLEVNYVFWIKGNLWALYVLPMCYDMWLPGDYLAYSLCDIGILAPRLCDGYWVPSLWRW